MLRALCWAIGLASATLSLAILIEPVSAHAAIPPPPTYQSLDARGVDLASGNFSVASASISVGPAANPLSFNLFYQAGTILNWIGANYYPYLASNLQGAVYSDGGSGFLVALGGSSEQFLPIGGGVFVAAGGGSATLAQTGSSFYYIAGDGTLYSFDPATDSSGASASLYPIVGSGSLAVLNTVIRPGGEWVFYTYNSNVANPGGSGNVSVLQDVRSTRGYQIHLTYDGAYGTVLTKVVAINTKVDPCSPTANDCGALAHAWPTFNVTYSSASSTQASLTLTDSDSRQTTFAYNAGTLTLQRTGVADVSYSGFGATSTSTATYSDGAGIWTYTFDWQTQSGWGGSALKTVTVTDPLGTPIPAGHQRVLQLHWVDPALGDPLEGRVTDDTNELSNTTHIDYDSYGRITKVTYPEGDTDNYAYDARGNVTQYQKLPRPGFPGTDSLTMTAQYPGSCYDPGIVISTCNKPLWSKDGLGRETDYAYDGYGELLSITAPANAGGIRPVTTFTYQPATITTGFSFQVLTHTSRCKDPAQATCVGTADEIATDICYGAPTSCTVPTQQGAPTSVTSRSGNGAVAVTASFGYDIYGNAASVTTPLGQSTAAFDMMRLPVGQVSPSVNGGPNPATVIGYYPNGLVHTVSQGLAAGGSLASFTASATTTSQYDPLGRKVQDYTLGVDGQTTVVNYNYDALSRLNCTALRMNPGVLGGPSGAPPDACTASAAGANGPDRITQNWYDGAGELFIISQVSTNAVLASFGFGADGEKTDDIDAHSNITTYDYDGILRLNRIRYPDPATGIRHPPGSGIQESFGYDAVGNLNSHTLRDGTVLSASYDALGNRVTDWNGASLTYDNASNVLSATLSGYTVSRAYDALGRTTCESATSTGTCVGTPSGATTYIYDAVGGLTRLTWSDGNYVTYNRNAATDAVTTIKENGASTLASYTYDDYGRRTGSSQLNGTSTAYGFDTLSRLTSLNQNLTAQSQALGFTYNPASQIAAKTTSNPLYDWTPPAPATRSYNNDRLNRVTNANGNTITYTDGRGNITSDGVNSYSYSYLNQLTGYTGASNSATLTYDGLGRLLQTYSSSTTTTRFAYAGNQLVAEYDTSGNITNRYVPGPEGQDDPVVWYEGPGLTLKRWLHADERGSVIAVTDASGSPIGGQPYLYDEYGVGVLSNTARFQYTGQIWIPEISLYHYKARDYSAALGRFLQTDPLGYAGGGMNLYAYAGNDPINISDPSGMDPDPYTCSFSTDKMADGCDPYPIDSTYSPASSGRGTGVPGVDVTGCRNGGTYLSGVCVYFTPSLGPPVPNPGGSQGGNGGDGGTGSPQYQQLAQNNNACHVADPTNGVGAAVGSSVAAQSAPTVATRGKMGAPRVPTGAQIGNWTSPASAALRGPARWGALKPITGTPSVGGSLAEALGPLGIAVVILDAITDAVVGSRAPQPPPGQQPDNGMCLTV